MRHWNFMPACLLLASLHAQAEPALVRQHGISAPLRVLALSPGTPASQAPDARGLALRQATPRRTARPARLLQASPAINTLAAKRALPALAQVGTGGTAFNFDGMRPGSDGPSGVAGAAGADQFVQSAGAALAVYATSDGAMLLGPLDARRVFGGLAPSAAADACHLGQSASLAVHYDQLARRWFLSWLAQERAGNQVQCIAVSTSPDATGSYYRYMLPFGSAGAGAGVGPGFADDPVLALWPDALLLTFVMFERRGGAYRGPRACALGRHAMLRGAAADLRCHDLGALYGPLSAASLDGTEVPLPGTPGLLLALDADQHGHGARLFMWRISLHGAALSDPIAIPVAPYSLACSNCILQPAPGERLEVPAERLATRLPYRHDSGRNALLVSHAVRHVAHGDAHQQASVALRWYELRDPGGAVHVYQQGTLAPDSNSRWMGSMAMDKMGNIAFGYNVAGPGTPPGIRYAGRQRSDPPGRMQGEEVIVNGTGVQQDPAGRWGGAGSMTLDPLDDCRFWHTLQYVASSGHFTWRTRIASMRFANCQKQALPDQQGATSER